MFWKPSEVLKPNLALSTPPPVGECARVARRTPRGAQDPTPRGQSSGRSPAMRAPPWKLLKIWSPPDWVLLAPATRRRGCLCPHRPTCLIC